MRPTERHSGAHKSQNDELNYYFYNSYERRTRSTLMPFRVFCPFILLSLLHYPFRARSQILPPALTHLIHLHTFDEAIRDHFSQQDTIYLCPSFGTFNFINAFQVQNFFFYLCNFLICVFMVCLILFICHVCLCYCFSFSFSLFLSLGSESNS